MLADAEDVMDVLMLVTALSLDPAAAVCNSSPEDVDIWLDEDLQAGKNFHLQEFLSEVHTPFASHVGGKQDFPQVGLM